MVGLGVKPGFHFLFLLIFWVKFAVRKSAPYESFRSFPKEELIPLNTAYRKALDSYAAGNWTESIRYLELSLHLHRHFKESVRYCVIRCNSSSHEEPLFTAAALDLGAPLSVHWHLMRMASCQKKCRAHFPVLQLPPPSREILEEFRRRSPYRYLHFALSKLNDLQRAVPCAHTFLQRNPEDQEMLQLMEEYKNEYDLSGFLIDHEERLYEPSFVSAVKLLDSGNYNSSVKRLEEALRLYLQEFDLCQAECEGINHFSSEMDFYELLTEVYIDSLKCQIKCEENLMPNVGGYYVENFVSTIYHYLQYAYYKLNDGRRAVPCAYSYFLFQPEDPVMKDNLLYYKAYSQQWGLQSHHFTPRTEAVRYYNKTITQKQMLTFIGKYLETNDEDFCEPEENADISSESPDAEFEGVGDYEESIFASWTQIKGKGDAGEAEN
ncbi:PREDICTED: synaptonemal complex protein SC65-like [Cyprinodon variegatus]|uniref:Prolyl 3-hydroxylase family member 4 (inactive) n=1 Tax=Cyprinodon variegatus TaxID=28743 RepID=A0A3Q2CC66_CYPVA|nr:PREDICTED: synaptonemal complex protein SC65-like [Cyprinodon variegatus]